MASVTPPTSGELTTAMLYALKGDSKMTAEERAYVLDVTRRQASHEAERLLAFLDLLEGEREHTD